MSSRAATTSPAATEGGKTVTTRRRARLTPRAAVLVFSIFIVTMFSIAPIRGYLEQRSRLERLTRQAEELERQNSELQERVADLNDPRTLERLARECLGMVEPGEVAFVAVPRGRAPEPPSCG